MNWPTIAVIAAVIVAICGILSVLFPENFEAVETDAAVDRPAANCALTLRALRTRGVLSFHELSPRLLTQRFAIRPSAQKMVGNTQPEWRGGQAQLTD